MDSRRHSRHRYGMRSNLSRNCLVLSPKVLHEVNSYRSTYRYISNEKSYCQKNGKTCVPGNEIENSPVKLSLDLGCSGRYQRVRPNSYASRKCIRYHPASIIPKRRGCSICVLPWTGCWSILTMAYDMTTGSKGIY